MDIRLIKHAIFHPIIFFKRLRCVLTRCVPDMKTFRCKRCGKQYRIISASEYFGRVKQIAEKTDEKISK